MKGSMTQVASFDIFDTLVGRICGSPERMIDAIAYRALNDGVDGASAFKDIRIEAEARAIDRVGQERLTLEDIYSEYARIRGRAEAELYKNLEARAEIDMCYPITGGVNLYKKALTDCGRVILISDMYLPSEILEEMLRKCGITGYEALFVSSECGYTKCSGKLFSIAAKAIGVEADELTHVGDNFKSDYLMARRAGVKAHLIRSGEIISPLESMRGKIRRRMKADSSRDIEMSFRKGVNDDPAIAAGYCVFGPLLISFCRWIHEKKREIGTKKLFFVARDGYLIRRAYQALYPQEETDYLLASRRATTVPLLWKVGSVGELPGLIGLGRETALREMLSRLGVQRSEVYDTMFGLGLNEETSFLSEGIEKNEVFLSVYELLTEKIKNNSKQEFEAASAYYSEIFKDEKNVVLVDLGWRGSIQHAISELVDSIGLDISISGLYLGVSSESSWRERQPMSGFLFQGESGSLLEKDEGWFNALLESVFTAPHGSAERYTLDSQGGCDVVLTPYLEEERSSARVFMGVQAAALDFVKDYIANEWSRYGIFTKRDALDGLYRLGNEPSIEEAVRFGDCVVSYKEVGYLAHPSSGLFGSLFDPKHLVSEIKTCYWKPAYVTRLLGRSGQYLWLLKTMKKLAG